MAGEARGAEGAGGRAVRRIAAAVALAAAAAAGPSAAATITVQTLPGGTTISVRGTITLEDGRRLETIARRIPAPAGAGSAPVTVDLESNGGVLAGGLVMGATIRNGGFATSVGPGRSCLSACAYAWLGGSRRRMAEGAVVAFHAAYEPGRMRISSTGNALIGFYMNQLGLDVDAVVWATTPPPGAPMARLTPATADHLGIAIDPAPGEAARTAVAAFATIVSTRAAARRQVVEDCYQTVHDVREAADVDRLKRCYMLDYAAARSARGDAYFESRRVQDRFDARFPTEPEYRDALLERWTAEAEETAEVPAARAPSPGRRDAGGRAVRSAAKGAATPSAATPAALGIKGGRARPGTVAANPRPAP